MQTATYIHKPTREAVRARALSYIACDVRPGVTLDQHRRLIAHAVRTGSRYPDDPAGNYETTDGGW